MTNIEEHRFWITAKQLLRERLSLFEDKADDTIIDERIRGDIHMKGANLWILMFAIFVASIGLNVNSTAVIIGAMLISPLMGPIMGIGYGAGINDFTLLRRAFKNLAIATLIGLLTSTLYFWISPLDTAQSELLARTTPTVWDVLIGLFGGLAGIVAITRKEKTNVIPGVAIATALMPPLCTAGFGLATGHWSYFFGAFYLYTINFVFIALSAFLVVRAFNVAEKKYVDSDVAKRAQRYIVAVALLTILPSSYLAYQLVGQEVFKAKATAFVNEHLNFKNTNVAQVKINPKTYEVKVFLIGDYVPKSELDTIIIRLNAEGLEKAKLKVYQNGEREDVDVSTLKADIITDLYQNTKADLQAKEKEIARLKEEMSLLSRNRDYYSAIPNELETLFPKVTNVVLSQNYDETAVERNVSENRLILNVETKKRLSRGERAKIEKWLKMRTKSDNVKIIIH
ncbi:MAG: TIGR00341 family protein [Sulfuricurvum sp. GWF2_44_89]|uniref:TIGR00341 family protein n=1 Tax=Sulfuricurvum kujiense TaxID=148813 RepID=A0A2D3WM31_9BACT|nr:MULTISPECIES: TIGR00341 family protein [Sulfuricurvum]OHD79597.1 MAG: TIGR00341 family protein [Sulfuricurvum sp. GWF2_44_89]OHD95213.1 MAG: TIGR00341 family protein [Sulfuricurvum sp. RIFOXYD12_FULL_44_77]OHD99105.1 MAG: TIGR00341 family protein [Sulfuricurvum sp. RIFOXYD2_FULL_44_160]DAB38764.1 MAG TPA: TIGR00341 family protein [Sulfuricurvum kujiense]